MNTSTPKAGQAKREMTWRGRLTRHAASGLGVAAFCEYESVSTASFYRWRTLLSVQTETVADVAPAAQFIDLGAMRAKSAGVTAAAPTVAAEPGAIEISLDLGHGLVLRIVRR
jgi:hypothetical protein